MDGCLKGYVCFCLLLIKLLVKTPLHKKPPGSIPSHTLYVPQLSQKNLQSPLLPLSPVPSQSLLQLPPYLTNRFQYHRPDSPRSLDPATCL